MMYTFMGYFVPLIEDGRKKQTIRLVGKRRPARVGEMLQLYRDSRTKKMAKIIPDQECIEVTPLRLLIEDSFGKIAIEREGKLIEPLGPFAVLDGFLPERNLGPVTRMWQHFHTTAGPGDHDAHLIRWDAPMGGLI